MTEMENMLYDVFFYEAFEEEAVALRRHLPGTLRAGFIRDTIQESGHARPPAPLISIRTQSLIPPAWGTALEAVLSRSTGYDHLIRFRARCAPGPACGFLPLYCNRAVAEQAMLLWLALLRRLPRQQRQFMTFQRDALTGRECEGKTLVVAGVGNIGSQVARLGRGLDMRVLGVDPVRRFDDIVYVSLDAALEQADVLVCAMNLTPENRHLFDAARFERLKPGAIFVNVARGELVDVRALPALLEAGRLGGVGLDVYEEEPRLAVALRSGARPTADDGPIRSLLELARRDDVICTPHNAFNTAEAVERKAEQSIRQILHFREHGVFLWPLP